jgi:hypothetical protein
MSDSARRPAPPWGETIGFVDEPRGEGVRGPTFRVSGWALSVHRIRAIELRGAGATLVARYGLPREDVAYARPGYPDLPACGFSLDVDASALCPPEDVARCPLAVVAIAGDGRETLLGRRSLVAPAARARWSFVAATDSQTPFYLVPATSGVAAGGAEGLADWYFAYLSPTTAIGMRVPIL